MLKIAQSLQIESVLRRFDESEGKITLRKLNFHLNDVMEESIRSLLITDIKELKSYSSLEVRCFSVDCC